MQIKLYVKDKMLEDCDYSTYIRHYYHHHMKYTIGVVIARKVRRRGKLFQDQIRKGLRRKSTIMDRILGLPWMIQRLRLHASSAVGLGLIPAVELDPTYTPGRSCMPHRRSCVTKTSASKYINNK